MKIQPNEILNQPIIQKLEECITICEHIDRETAIRENDLLKKNSKTKSYTHSATNKS